MNKNKLTTKRKTKREFLAHYTLDGNILDRCRKGNGETKSGITTFSLSIRMTSLSKSEEIWQPPEWEATLVLSAKGLQIEAWTSLTLAPISGVDIGFNLWLKTMELPKEEINIKIRKQTIAEKMLITNNEKI